MDFKILEEKFQKALNVLIEDLSKVHAGRVTATLLKHITVHFEDGRISSIMEAGLIRVVNSKTLAIKPWNTSDTVAIEKSIRISNLGINPANKDGEIYLIFPDLTQERRKELAKLINTYAIDTKHKLRTIRHDFMKENKQTTKEEEIKLENSVQKIIDKFNKIIDEHAQKKQDEIVRL